MKSYVQNITLRFENMPEGRLDQRTTPSQNQNAGERGKHWKPPSRHRQFHWNFEIDFLRNLCLKSTIQFLVQNQFKSFQRKGVKLKLK